MCGIIGSVITVVIGAALIVATSIVGYIFVPDIIDDNVIRSVVLTDDTVQLERFKDVPFTLNFTFHVFNITNPQEVLTGGVPVINEVGPYIYKLYQSRNVSEKEEDRLTYRRLEHFEFDAEASYPNTEDDMLTIINIPYHAIIQVAEREFPELMSLLSLAMGGVFGNSNSPIIDVRVGSLVLEGVPFCQNPGLIGNLACNIIRDIAATAKNIDELPDGTLIFSALAYKQGIPSSEYEVYRGIENPSDIGRILTLDQQQYFDYWVNDTDEFGNETPSVCNMINGTDAGIFPPFVDREEIIYAINTDICRSVELRYQYDNEYEGIPSMRFAANEWFLDNDDGCFCLNVTAGSVQENGCLLRGALELYTCIADPADFVLPQSMTFGTHLNCLDNSAYLVLTYPHFLYADFEYRNGVLGLRPIEEDHRIYIDIEPLTGTPLSGAKRAQFNIFSRPVNGIPATQNLRTTLMPIFWVAESYNLPEEFVDELRSRLMLPLTLVDILVPVLIALGCVLFLGGIILAVRSRKAPPTLTTSGPRKTET